MVQKNDNGEWQMHNLYFGMGGSSFAWYGNAELGYLVAARFYDINVNIIIDDLLFSHNNYITAEKNQVRLWQRNTGL